MLHVGYNIRFIAELMRLYISDFCVFFMVGISHVYTYMKQKIWIYFTTFADKLNHFFFTDDLQRFLLSRTFEGMYI